MFRNVMVLLIASSIIQISQSIVCTPGICAAVSCVTVENCDGPNKVVKPGGFCKCCDLCHTILGENESCNSLFTVLQGSPPPLEECGNGLICYEGKCTSFKNLTPTTGKEKGV